MSWIAVIAQELARLGWTENDPPLRPKNDPDKLSIAIRIRKETTLTIKWIAVRLHLGSAKSARALLHDQMQNHQQPLMVTSPAKLQFQPMV